MEMETVSVDVRRRYTSQAARPTARATAIRVTVCAIRDAPWLLGFSAGSDMASRPNCIRVRAESMPKRPGLAVERDAIPGLASELDGIAQRHDAACHDTCINTAPPGMTLVRDAVGVAVVKRSPDLLAWRGVGR